MRGKVCGIRSHFHSCGKGGGGYQEDENKISGRGGGVRKIRKSGGV